MNGSPSDCHLGHVACRGLWEHLRIEERTRRRSLIKRVTLLEQRSDVRHGPEQPHWLVRERQKAFALVETTSTLVFGIYDHGERRDLAARSSEQGIGEQETPMASCSMALIDGKSTKERRRNERIAGKAPSGLGRKLCEFYGRRRQGVVAGDGTVWQHKDERRRHVLAGVLPGLTSEISV
jgi:hypothetical protein